jgi:hypothetical protein
MKKSIPLCQSCGMPFDKAHSEYAAKEKDGSKSIYCSYCYKDGEYLVPGATIDDVVEMGVPHLARKIGEQAAREHLSKLLPTLERWKE